MKILAVPLIVLLCIIAVLDELIALVFLGEKIAYSSFFFGGAKQEIKVPGTWTDYVQQGFDLLEDGKFIVSAHSKKDDNAAVFIVENDESTLCQLKTVDGSTYYSHAGGVTHYKEWLYIATDNHQDTKGDKYCTHDNCDTNLDMFLLADVLDGDGVATQVGSIVIPNRLAYATIRDDTLYAGAFYRNTSKYITPESHHVTTPAGDENTALMMVYTMNPVTGKPMKQVPEYCYSTTSQVQGMCFTGDGDIVLSTSWGISASHIYQYDVTAATQGTISLNGTELPLYHLDSACLIKHLRIPPMSEGIVWSNDRLYILTESASMKYLFGKITSGNHVYSYPLT